MNYIINGDSLQELKKLPNNSIDSVVTDPPYELGFMGKSWDNTGIANNVELWEEVLRVLKPGGHMLAFSGTRTYHRMVVAIEDAGFEIRDMINWTYGSGFPKNHDISKAIDKKFKAERKVIGPHPTINGKNMDNFFHGNFSPEGPQITEPATDEAKQWQGFGTALKPSHEPIVLARKPVEGTIAENVLKYGTGALNIDDSRVDTNGEKLDVGGRGKHNRGEGYGFQPMGDYEIPEGQGRYPANTILAADEEVTALFPDSKGAGPSLPKVKVTGYGTQIGEGTYEYEGGERIPFNAGEGSAARFFKQIEYDPIIYQAKASKKERNKGLDDFEPQAVNDGREKDIDNPYQRGTTPRKNTHPTVKPIKLMEYLVKMITPPGGVVLDPFAGSGTTLIAAKTQGFNYIGIELTPEYVEIAEARLKAY
jgi:site-specific DNA-methyltransferase (adenine-specific)